MILRLGRDHLQAPREESEYIDMMYEDRSRQERRPRNFSKTKEALRELFRKLREACITVVKSGG